MKDPIQGALDAVREVEIRVGQIRLLWAEAERAKEAAEAEVKSLRARKDEDVERFRARAEQDRRDRFACEESLEAAHAAIWGLGCVVTNLLQSGCVEAKAESYERELKRLRRSNEQVREVLGANHGESPVEAAKRLRADKDAMGREIERLRNERDVALARVVKLEKSCREGEQEVQALQESWSAVRAKRDKAVARVEELEREVAAVRSLRQTVRDECAAALFEVFRTSETLDTAFYGFAAALDVVAKELSALRKDRETLNRVRSAVEVKS